MVEGACSEWKSSVNSVFLGLLGRCSFLGALRILYAQKMPFLVSAIPNNDVAHIGCTILSKTL